MLAFADNHWALLLVMVAFYLVLCGRTAWAMRRSGRSFWKWLVISIFTTSIPATMLMIRDQHRGYCPADLEGLEVPAPTEDAGGGGGGAESEITCPKCGRRMRWSQLRRISGKPKCPHCGRKIDKSRNR